LTSEEYARRVQATILSAGARMMEQEQFVGANGPAGLYQLALGGANAVRGKGREYEVADDVQSFERPDAKCVDWLAEVKDELTDAAAWLTAASEISRMTKDERDKYVAFISWHLALAIDAVEAWAIWERVVPDMTGIGFIRPEDQPA
jgi:hypothetical protein